MSACLTSRRFGCRRFHIHSPETRAKNAALAFLSESSVAGRRFDVLRDQFARWITDPHGPGVPAKSASLNELASRYEAWLRRHGSELPVQHEVSRDVCIRHCPKCTPDRRYTDLVNAIARADRCAAATNELRPAQTARLILGAIREDHTFHFRARPHVVAVDALIVAGRRIASTFGDEPHRFAFVQIEPAPTGVRTGGNTRKRKWRPLEELQTKVLYEFHVVRIAQAQPVEARTVLLTQHATGVGSGTENHQDTRAQAEGRRTQCRLEPVRQLPNRESDKSERETLCDPHMLMVPGFPRGGCLSGLPAATRFDPGPPGSNCVR